MAKKSFDISSTLKKNKETQLAPKIPLKKTTKDVEEVREKVDLIHTEQEREENSSPATKPSRATGAAKRQSKAKTNVPSAKPKLVRLTIDTPEEMHKKLKIRAIEKGISMRDYILQLMYQELNSK